MFPVWYYRWYRFWCCLFSRFSYFVSWCGCRFRRWFLFGILIGIVAGIASIWFSLAQGVKRLHDLNKSGWLILICCVPIIGWVFSLYMLFADGTVGPNQYGEDPKNRMPYQPQPTSVNVTVNVSRETPAEAPAEEEKTEKAE
ncbi:DUF805 domain-containing protein [Bacteroides thetaiotaomicron]|nr:DUF805 domain-containing protein [Bacteroides thetaiotaomicron]